MFKKHAKITFKKRGEEGDFEWGSLTSLSLASHGATHFYCLLCDGAIKSISYERSRRGKTLNFDISDPPREAKIPSTSDVKSH